MSGFGKTWYILKVAMLAFACACLVSVASAQSLDELKSLAGKGNTEAQLTLGKRHYYGDGDAPSDYAEALRWFLMAAETGNAEAQGWAGSLYRGMKGVPRDHEKAKFWYNKAIAQGDSSSAYNLSNLHKEELNYIEALRFLKLYGTLAADELYEEEMEDLAKDIAGLESLISAGSPAAGASAPGPQPAAPALLPGEFLQQTTRGCHIVSWLPDTVPTAVRQQAEEDMVRWDGNCRHGRAHGKGNLLGLDGSEFAFGYWRGSPVTMNDQAGNRDAHYFVPALGMGIVRNTDLPSASLPVWQGTRDGNAIWASLIQMYDTLNWNQFHVSTNQMQCFEHFKGDMTPAQKKALRGKRCRGNEGDVQVYYISTSINTHAAIGVLDITGFRKTDHFCPDPTRSAGCESVWTREVAPFLPRMTMLIESAVALAARRAQEDQAVAVWSDYDRKLEAWRQAATEADKAAADRARAQKAAAAELARLEARARQEAEQKEFADSLKTLNPGQLLVKADELDQQGRTEDARTLRREILSRFPDHPLAVIAAQKLTEVSGVPSGLESDFAALRKRAEMSDAEAQLELARAYYSGNGVAQDRPEAARWYRAAADQGNADAQNYLGVMLDGGVGIPKNPAEAALYYRLAAEQGHAFAQRNLGTLYFSGNGVVQNREEAARWYRKAADQGDADAQNYLGVMLSDGTDLPQDYAEAARYFRLSADQGNANAQNNLGNAYSYGSGVPRDLSVAATWFRAAAKKGHKTAPKNLATVEKLLADEAYEKRLSAQRAEEARRAEEQRQREQQASDSNAWGMLAAGGLTAALGGSTEQVLGAMLGQPVDVPQNNRSGSAASAPSCSGANRTLSCLLEHCRGVIAERRQRDPGGNLECRVSAGRDGDECVAFIDHENVGNYSISCTSGFGAAR